MARPEKLEVVNGLMGPTVRQKDCDEGLHLPVLIEGVTSGAPLRYWQRHDSFSPAHSYV